MGETRESEFEELMRKYNDKCDECGQLNECIDDFEVALTDARAMLIEHGISDAMQTACKSEIE